MQPALFPPGELEAFHQATLALASSPTLHGVLQATVQGAVRLAGASHGTLLLSKSGASGASSNGAPGGTRVEYSSPYPLAGLDGESGEAGEELSLPVATRVRPVGVLSLRGAQSGGERQVLLRSFCEQAAHTIENTRRFEQLQHAKREWELIFDGMVDGVYIMRADGIILRSNRASAQMLGLRLADILGRKRAELHAHLRDYQVLRPWHNEDGFSPNLDLQTMEFRFGSPERVFVDTIFTLLSNTSPDHEEDLDNDARRVCIMRDVTEQRRLQEQLLQSEKLAALGELVSGVAHELNNPLTTVVGYGQLLETDPSVPANAKRQISMIHHEAQRASHIVQNLLAFARRSVPQKSRVDINEVLGSLVRMRSYQLTTDNVRVVTHLGEDLPLVWADPMQLQQVFLNIINNAAHAVMHGRDNEREQGEIRVSTEPVPPGTRRGAGAKGVIVAVEDNGPGISPEHLRRVFDPFFTTKGVGQGTGLGMSISLGIVSNHGGRIWAESRLGHGARFMVELPGSSGDDEADPTPVPIPEVVFHDGPQSRILVVDDEEPVVTLISEILSMDGHHITPAFNGAEALNLLEHRDFDLILSDVRMPAVGGPTFFEILQTTRPDLLPRVVFVTGDTVSRSTQEFLQRAARPVLAKPFDPDRLRAIVTENLRLNQGG